MRREVLLANVAPVDVRVDLRGRYVAVTEHLLQDAQVGAPFEQMRREAVPQLVRRGWLDEAGIAQGALEASLDGLA